MRLEDNITTIKGIGHKKASLLKTIRIDTVGDLLDYYPRNYEDRRQVRSISTLNNEETALIRGKILLIIKGRYSFHRKQTLKLLVQDETGSIEVVFFNAGYLEKTLKKDVEYDFFGKVTINHGKFEMLHPEVSKYEKGKEGCILPIYPLTKGLSQGEMRKWQHEIKPLIPELTDYLPADIIERNRLCGLSYAVSNIHFPGDFQRLKEAKYRLIFDELLLLQTGLLAIKNKMSTKERGVQFSNAVRMDSYVNTLPYKLTGAQRRVLSEINDDMESMKVMNRLVQGDVGSGKTALAAAALYKAVKSGYQGVMMAPTELLARQHYQGFVKDFSQQGIQVGFLSGSISLKEKNILLEQIETGVIDVIVGTHAIIQPNVKFKNLGLVITDEQHRFGVNQRMLLSQKGENPDILVMTATPIPRTLAVILYGDLDISIIDEMPPGRQAIITRAVRPEGREAAYEFVKREVMEGRQAYIVAPLIEDSENLHAKSATSLYEELMNDLHGLKIALLHGGMKQIEKDKIMSDFYSGAIDILVSTVVIEVGINVPNATIMLIENAERFGLAQLHQLRGRVGRGQEQSYCVLITDGESKVAEERAEIMKGTSDGFVIAEKDLELRGPGELFGTRQHGIPELKLADLLKHSKILIKVHEEAKYILENDEFLTQPKNKTLKDKIETMFKNIEMISI